MIRARGFIYENDWRVKHFTRQYPSVDALLQEVKHDAIDIRYVHTPARTPCGIDRRFSRSFPSDLSYPIENGRDGYILSHITLIENEKGILYSNGEKSRDDGFIGSIAMKLFADIDEWASQRTGREKE